MWRMHDGGADRHDDGSPGPSVSKLSMLFHLSPFSSLAHLAFVTFTINQSVFLASPVLTKTVAGWFACGLRRPISRRQEAALLGHMLVGVNNQGPREQFQNSTPCRPNKELLQ